MKPETETATVINMMNKSILKTILSYIARDYESTIFLSQRMTRPLLFISSLLFLFACGKSSDDQAKELTFENQAIPLKDKIKKATSDEYLSNLGFKSEDIELIQEVYRATGYKANWINDSALTEKGKEVKELLEKPLAIGLPDTRSSLNESYNFIQEELTLTLALSKTVNDLRGGIIDYEKGVLKPKANVSADTLIQALNLRNAKNSRLKFLGFGPRDTTYSALAKGLIKYYDTYPIDTNTFQVVTNKKDSALALKLAEEALLSKGYIKIKTGDTTVINPALRIFQLENGLKPDAVIGKYTSRCLNESTQHKLLRVALAMDKIRAHDPYPPKCIRINIPEYMLRFYEQDTLRSEHKIIVGTDENQTPELESKLRKIVVYPYWSVPYSIASKEILPALKYNPGYLARNNYKLFRKGEEVDPYSVNWRKIGENSFPFKVIQQPGKGNSLGVIKFDFPNSSSVYFHDTPSKGLFGTDVRSYSHGCMRTHKPVDLAKKVLEYDSLPYHRNDIIPDSLDSILARNENYEIALVDRFPIFIEYMSVVSVNQEMIVHYDIYNRDEKYLKLFAKKDD